MTKKKKKQDNQPVNLTEWQKRNIEFLEKKKAKEEEEKKLKEKLLVEKKEEIQKSLEEVEMDSDTHQGTDGIDSDQEIESEIKKEKVVKLPKIKKEKSRRQKAFIKALPVLLLSLLILSLSIFMLTPYSKSKEFTAKGNKYTSLVELIDQSKIKDSDYISNVLFSSGKYENAVITNNPWVKNVSIDYDFPNHFIFNVKEYKIIAYAQETKGFQPILENGRRVTIVNKAELPKSYLIINLKDENDIQNLVKTLTKLPEELVKNIKSVSMAKSKVTQDLLLVELHDGNTIRVPQSQILEKMPYYLKIKKKLEGATIVDMEAGIYSTTSEIEARPVVPIEDKDALKPKKKTAESSETTTDSANTGGDTASSEQSSETTVPNQEAEPSIPAQ